MENNKPKLILCLALVLSGGWFGCSTAKPPAQPIPASGVNWMGLTGYIGPVFSHEKPILCLLSPGTPPVDEHEAALIIGFAGPMNEAMMKWFREHRKAVVVTIAHLDTSGTKVAALKYGYNYVWVVAGDQNLNLELVRQGFIASNTQTGVNPKDLKIPRADYDAFVQKALQAGKEAKEKKVGMWMDGLPK